MKNTIKSRKGVTLTELVVVLAVVVIAAGMVVTFSSMMHGAQGISNERYEALQDVRTAEALIEGFILNNTEEGYYLEWSETNKVMKALNFYRFSDGTYESKSDHRFVQFTGSNAFVMSGVNDANSPVMFLEHIKTITFEVVCGNEVGSLSTPPMSESEKFLYSSASNDILYYCTITYRVSTTDYTYTFCVNPYVGEGVN